MPFRVFVVYRPFPTSNHNPTFVLRISMMLYIVRFLHQTTTVLPPVTWSLKLYIVRFLHQTTTYDRSYIGLWRCISSVSYIKPQLTALIATAWVCCISSVSYIKPQHIGGHSNSLNSCISSVSYIKPQRCVCQRYACWVVYRPFPTSNHNSRGMEAISLELYIVRFLHQTTTIHLDERFIRVLYIVRFLHQTTTMMIVYLLSTMLYIVRFLHQTTTMAEPRRLLQSCISSVSYIKPQHTYWQAEDFSVVYRPFPTSNHNPRVVYSWKSAVVYRPFPTSNHNCLNPLRLPNKLYIVRFLHQTTTIHFLLLMILQLYIVRFLHQTTTEKQG